VPSPHTKITKLAFIYLYFTKVRISYWIRWWPLNILVHIYVISFVGDLMENIYVRIVLDGRCYIDYWVWYFYLNISVIRIFDAEKCCVECIYERMIMMQIMEDAIWLVAQHAIVEVVEILWRVLACMAYVGVMLNTAMFAVFRAMAYGTINSAEIVQHRI